MDRCDEMGGTVQVVKGGGCLSIAVVRDPLLRARLARARAVRGRGGITRADPAWLEGRS